MDSCLYKTEPAASKHTLRPHTTKTYTPNKHTAMEKFLSDACSGIAKEAAAEKAGDLVRDAVQACLGGDKKEEESSGSGFNPGDLISLATGAKEDNNSGLNIGNVISGLTGDKKEEEGGSGIDLLKTAGGLFK